MGKNYVTLYDPKEFQKRIHKCDLPDLRQERHKLDNERIWWQTIVECEECAKRWVALTYSDRPSQNEWTPLRWYHFKWQKNLWRATR